MSLATVRVGSLCLLLLLYIISGTRTVSAEMKGIPRTEVAQICAVVDTDKKNKDITLKKVLSVPETAVTISPKVLPTAEKPPSLSADTLFEMINTHRVSLGLPAYQKEEQLCALAQERCPELYDEIFTSGNIHGGLYNRNLPFWITENMKYGDNEHDVLNWWLSSSIHRKAIEGNFLYSCGECYGNSCAQLFTSYVAK